MFAVTAMHEQVHERTSQQREPENYAKQMGAMFGPKISADHGEQDDKMPVGTIKNAPRRPQLSSRSSVMTFALFPTDGRTERSIRS